MAEQITPPLTFGVEIELLLGVLTPKAIDPHPLDPRYGPGVLSAEIGRDLFETFSNTEAFKHIEDTLTLVNLAAGSEWEWVNDADHYNHVGTDCWCMTEDASLDNPDNSTYTWVRLEIRSPAFHVTPEAFEQVRAVCEVLTNTYRVCCHQSAGLHVHVGQESNGFPITILRNLMSTLFTFEDQIDEIHPRHRINNLWSKALRTHSQLGKLIINDGVSKEDALMLLLAANDPNADPSALVDSPAARKELLELIGWSGPNYTTQKLSYNTLNLKDKAFSSNEKRTIEYRQHESTVDGQQITSWAQLCVGVVEFSYAVNYSILGPFLQLHTDAAADFPLVHVLKAMGLTPQMLFYGTRPPHKVAKPHWWPEE
jgi:hypothetical protein